MILAIHADALHHALILEDDESITRHLAHSRIVASEWILNHFESKFRSTTEKDLFQAFLSSIGNTGNVKMVDDIQDGSELDLYENASHFAGKNFVVLSAAKLSIKDLTILTKRGTRIRQLNAITYQGSQAGISPFEIHKLPHQKSQDPQNIIGAFFGGAKEAVFYDKYMNDRSCALISMAASKMSENSNITIVTSEKSHITHTEIRASVKIDKSQKLSIEVADVATENFFHERYCYIDTGYEIYAPRGLDCFGKPPNWLNSNTTVSIFDNHDGKEVVINCKPRPGRKKTLAITVKSKLIS